MCERCRLDLPYVDWWRACRRCGSPFGLVQCDLCNPMALERLGVKELPFDSCTSAVHYVGDTGQIVRVFKDQGEQRLADDMARLLSRVIDPGWSIDAVTFVPATSAAVRSRGYDHAELLARSLAGLLDAECAQLLNRPRTHDQRALSGAERIANLKGSFTSRERSLAGARLLLVDDVFTTGATLCAASQALREAGTTTIHAATFARV